MLDVKVGAASMVASVPPTVRTRIPLNTTDAELRIQALEEAVLLTADAALDLRANQNMEAQGVAIEAGQVVLADVPSGTWLRSAHEH